MQPKELLFKLPWTDAIPDESLLINHWQLKTAFTLIFLTENVLISELCTSGYFPQLISQNCVSSTSKCPLLTICLFCGHVGVFGDCCLFGVAVIKTCLGFVLWLETEHWMTWGSAIKKLVLKQLYFWYILFYVCIFPLWHKHWSSRDNMKLWCTKDNYYLQFKDEIKISGQ